MNRLLLFLCASILLLSACKENPYPGYTVTYNKGGMIVLQHPDSVSMASQDVTKSMNTDPNAGRPITKDQAIDKIIAFQAETAGEPITKYVDMYYPSLRDYLLKMLPKGDNEKDYGVRIYFAGNRPTYSVILGPIKKTGKTDRDGMDIMEPLWYTNPAANTAFNYGSVCPEKCPNGDLTGLEGTEKKAVIDSIVKLKQKNKNGIQ